MSRSLIVLAVALLSTAVALDNGVVLTPPMGWLSWERYACELNCTTHPEGCINEDLYYRMADALVDFGYANAGYNYVNIDDCWPAPRGPQGELVADPKRFPHGIKALADYVHAKGLKLGIYLDIGSNTCDGYTGFNVPVTGNDTQYIKDVNTLASWEIDSLKVDGCYADPKTMNITYPKLSLALNATGRPIAYACSWPDYVRLAGYPVQYDLLVKYCNYWRNFDDIGDDYDSVNGIINYWKTKNDELSPVPRPGAFNDADMLMIGGTGLSFAQEQIQMAIWSIIASPLLMSNDLYNIEPASREILLNPEAIAVNQDKLGKAGSVVYFQDNISVWKRLLSNGDYAVVLLNSGNFGPVTTIGFNASDLPIVGDFKVRDLFAHEDLGVFSDSFAADVTTTSCLFLRVSAYTGDEVKTLHGDRAHMPRKPLLRGVRVDQEEKKGKKPHE